MLYLKTRAKLTGDSYTAAGGRMKRCQRLLLLLLVCGLSHCRQAAGARREQGTENSVTTACDVVVW